MLAGLNVKELAKKAALNAVMSNPLVKQATEVVAPVKALVDPQSPKSLGHLEETLKTAVKETVDAKVTSSLAAAGVTPGMANPDAVAKAAVQAAVAATGDKANAGSGNAGSGNEGSGNAGSGNAGSGNEGSGNAGSGNADSGNAGSGNADSGNAGSGNNSGGNEGDQEGGSRRYEIVTLSSPIDEPLFVCYKSGKPVYFTNSSRGLNILPFHTDVGARYKAPAKKRKATKKSSKKRSKKLSRKRR
jgi:PPE-repeat protein